MLVRRRTLESGSVRKSQIATLPLNQPILLEPRQKSRHRLSRSPNDLSDFLMSQGELRIGLIMEQAITLAPIEKKCRKFFWLADRECPITRTPAIAEQ